MKSRNIATTAFLLSILMCVVFADHAMAGIPLYSLSQIGEQTKEGWHRSYHAHGRTIEVDTPILVPEVDFFPAIKVAPATPSDLVPITDKNALWGHIEDDVEIDNIPFCFRWFSPSNQLMNELAVAYPPPQGVSIYSNILSVNELEWDTAYAVRNPSTVRNADTLLRRIWAQYFPELPLDTIPYRVEAGMGARPFNVDTMEYYGDEWEAFEGSLDVIFHQVIHGILFFGTMEQSFEGGTILNSRTFYRGRGPFCMVRMGGNVLSEKHTKEIEHVQIMGVQEVALIAEDLPLCGIEQVISAYEKLIDQGKLRRVDNLRLGYVGWYNKNEQDTLTLMPTWVAEGVLIKDPKREPYSQDTSIRDTEFAYIMVNAQTGELVEPWDDYPNRVYEVPEIVRRK